MKGGDHRTDQNRGEKVVSKGRHNFIGCIDLIRENKRALGTSPRCLN